MSCAIRVRSRSRACSATRRCSRSSRAARSHPARTSSRYWRRNRPANHGSIAATSSKPTNRLAHPSHAGTRSTATTAAASTAARAAPALRFRPGCPPARNAQSAAGTPHHRLAAPVPTVATVPTNRPAASTGAANRALMITVLTDATLRNRDARRHSRKSTTARGIRDPGSGIRDQGSVARGIWFAAVPPVEIMRGSGSTSRRFYSQVNVTCALCALIFWSGRCKVTKVVIFDAFAWPGTSTTWSRVWLVVRGLKSRVPGEVGVALEA